MKKILCALLIAMLFLQGSAPVMSARAENRPLFETVGKVGENLAASKADWELSDGWELDVSRDNVAVSSDGTGKGHTFFRNANLSGIWCLFFRLDLTQAGSREAVVSVPLGISVKSARVTVLFTRHPAGLTSVSVDVTGYKRRVLHSGWISGGDKVFDVAICRKSAEKNALTLEIYGDNTFVYRETTPDLDMPNEVVKGFGFAADGFPVNVTGISAGPAAEEGKYLGMAKAAIGDMIKNFWEKGPSAGHIKTTWCGYASDRLPDKHGMMWERALMIIPMYSLYRLTLDPVLESRLKSEWSFIRTLFTEEELSAAGGSLHPAVDDSGWSALGYLCLYKATKDEAALRAAERMTDNAIARWRDGELGGGLWYNNERQFKSIYQCGVLMSLMSIWEIRKTDTAKKKFFDIYDWIEKTLRRDDGLYWVDYFPNGPDGQSRPYDIREGGSVTCLMANMAMAVINARLYHITGDDGYRKKALATADGIYEHETQDGIYLNDRDAWANGTYAAEWAVQVLTLPGIDKKHLEIAKKTADSIFANARTCDGYYGGSWGGPADGLPSKWFSVGSRPQQIMTSGSTVNMLVAAAIVEEQERGMK